MTRARPSNVAMMILCLTAGFGISYLRHDGGVDRQKSKDTVFETKRRTVRTALTTHAAAPKELWLEGKPLDLQQVKARLLQACSSNIWTEELEQGAVLVLIAEPSFINTLFRKTNPEAEDWAMDRILWRMSKDCPRSILPLLDAADFDLTLLDSEGKHADWGYRDWATGLAEATSHEPQETLDTLRRNRHKFSSPPNAILNAYSGYPVSARALLADAERDMKDDPLSLYREGVPELAEVVVFQADALHPSELGFFGFSIRSVEAAKAIEDWMNGGKKLDPESRDDAHNIGHSIALERLSYEQRSLTPGQFQELIDMEWGREASHYLEGLVSTGRESEAFELFRNYRPAEGDALSKGTLAWYLIEAIHEYGGNVGEAAQLMGDRSGLDTDEQYLEKKTDRLIEWAEADPVAARQYLPTVTDPELREKLGETIERASMEP